MGFKNLPPALAKELKYHYPGDKFVKRPKYSNRSCRCWLGHWHQSILEADYCNELGIRKKCGDILDFTIQHKIDIVVAGEHITNHYVDFRVMKNDARFEFHEVKGYEQEVWKIKKRLCEALFPEIPYIVKFEKPKGTKWTKK